MENQNEMNTQEPKAKKSKKFTLNTIVDYVVKFLPVITVSFLALAIIALVYDCIAGVAGSIATLVNGGGFTGFVGSLFGGLESGIGSVAKYVFYALISASFSKILNRK